MITYVYKIHAFLSVHILSTCHPLMQNMHISFFITTLELESTKLRVLHKYTCLINSSTNIWICRLPL